MARTPQSTRTCTMRSSEHAAHRLLMHSGHTSHLWLKVSPCVSFHVIHACAPVCCSLSVSPHPSFYFLVLFLFQLYLMSNSAPDEFSIEDPLCNSSLGSMVTLDYVTPLTCSSSKVPICAFELFSPTGFPVLSTIFSAWVFSENLL